MEEGRPAVARPARTRRVRRPALRRFGVTLWLQIVIVGVVAVATALIIATAAVLANVSTAGGRQLLDEATAQRSSIAVQTRLAADGSAQSEAAEAFFRERFTGIPISVTRTLRLPPMSVAAGVAVSIAGSPSGIASDVQLILESDAGLASAARLTAGQWPSAPTGSQGTELPAPAAVQADAAAALGVGIGDVLSFATPDGIARVQVAALWRPIDPTAARWHGDPAPATGRAGTVLGPVILDEAALTSLQGDVSVRWVVAPRIDALDPDAIALLAEAAATDGILKGIERDGRIAVGAAAVDGDLSASAARASQAVGGAAGISGIPLAVTAALAILTLLQLGALLVATRAGESVVLRARGMSSPQLFGAAVLESLATVIPGVLIGTLAGGALGGGPALPPLAAPTSIGAAAVVLLLCATFGTWRPGSAATSSVQVARSEVRDRSAVALGAGFVAIAAGLGVWQLVTAAPPASLVATVAPVLALLAIVLILAASARPIAAQAARRTTPLRGFPVVHGARALARQTAAFRPVILIVALTTGAATLGAGILGTADALDARTALTVVGSDVRASFRVQGTVSDRSLPITARPFEELTGVDAAIVALAAPGAIGSDAVDLVALPAARMGEVVDDSGPEGAVGRMAAAIRAPTESASIHGLSIEVVTDASAERTGGVRVAAWLVDPDGAVALVPLGSAPLQETRVTPAVLSAPLPDGDGWRLLALDTELQGSPGADAISVQLTSQDSAVGEIGPARLASSQPSARVLVTTATVTELPVVVSRPLADLSGLSVGSTFTLALRTGAAIPARVAVITATIPGSTGSRTVLADLPSLDAAMLGASGPILQPAEVWLSTADPAAVSAELVAIAPAPVELVTQATASVQSLLRPIGLLLGTGLLVGSAIAALAFGAAARRLALEGADEMRVLRALGRGPRGQARASVVVLGIAAGFGGLIGVAGGALAAVICAPAVARVAVPVPDSAVPLVFAAEGLLPGVLFALAVLVILALPAARPALLSQTLAGGRS